MSLVEKLLCKTESLSVVGLGYVGIPIALAFSKKMNVIGFDLDMKKIDLYKSGIDPTGEMGDDEIKKCEIHFTSDAKELKNAKFHIVAVPTPVKADCTPDLSQIENASRILGKYLTKGSIVVFESTVFPGMTEEVCIPILEKESNLKCGLDFFVGYSPERINPGDKVHRFENIKKIISAIDQNTLDEVSEVYETVLTAGVHKAPSIKVAEAAKVVENTQRDINIAFMNELSIIFGKMGIDTKDVLEAAGTKWNFMKFTPGLVGGQCIGVDPYYLIHRAKQLGYESKVISAGRTINDYMGEYVGENIVRSLLDAKKPLKKSKVVIMGFTFKENFPDIRNTKVFDIISSLRENGIEPMVYDPVASAEEVYNLYGVQLCRGEDISKVDCLVFAVSHEEFLKYDEEYISSLFASGKKVLIDVKGMFDRLEFEKAGYIYWRL